MAAGPARPSGHPLFFASPDESTREHYMPRLGWNRLTLRSRSRSPRRGPVQQGPRHTPFMPSSPPSRHPPGTGGATAIRSPCAAAWKAAGSASSKLDSSDLSGVRRVRLEGSRSMLTVLKDQGGDYVEVTGDLELGRSDRLEARRKVKVADKTTISIGASAEQVSSDPVAPPDPTLVVDSFTALGERCPKN